MKFVKPIVLLAVLAALGVWLWTVLFPSPEKIIRKQLLSLARDVSFSQSENDLAKIARAQNIPNFFASNVVVNVTVPNHEQKSIIGRDEILQAALATRQTSGIDLKFPDINVEVAPDKNSATADVTVDANVSGEHDAILQEVKFTFEKVDGKWLIDKVETVRVLSRAVRPILAFQPSKLFLIIVG